MAKVFWVEDEEQFDHKSHIGCMSGIFHALDYQLWHSNVKKILPHRKYEGLVKHAKRNRRYKRISDDQDPFEVLQLLDAKTSHILVDQSNKKTSSNQKRSLKARIKALVSDENDKERDPNFVLSPKLQRTCSIHHLESNEWVHPIIFFPENVTESPVSSDSITNPEMTESQNILDMFEVDKKLFSNILQDQSQITPDTKPILTKSGSFPTAYKPGSRNLMPMRLNDKLNEFFTRSKSEKRLDAELNRENENMRLRRISSLNESADRYSQLFDFSVSKEATLRPSRSLKLTNVSESLLSGQELSFPRRIYSLPRLDNPNQESREIYSTKIDLFRSSSQTERNPVSVAVSTDKYAELNSTQDCESLNEVMEKSDKFSENEHFPKIKSPSFGEDTSGLTIEEDKIQKSQEIADLSPVVAPECCSPDEKVQISEAFQENIEKEIKTFNGKKHLESSIRRYQEDDDFTYVKQILERSGFTKNGFEQTWHSSNQPLDPFVFQEIESQYFHDPERFEEEINELSRRLLIFDLVDEVLLTMYERSLSYYPKALSSFCHIRPAPSGPHVLDEVWKRVSRIVNLKPDSNESLNDIVSRDMGNDDAWMSLQLDFECVGLDLEDLILDEVLEEMLFDFI